ncbi:MAG TPA: hypothetical protein EYP25_06920 [Anaerolineae bacterium]|nr:hypothetical protein [Anaerolineae bacterium]
MAEAQKDQAQAPPEENPILLAKKRAAERIKARFHQEERHPMNVEKAHQWFLKEKSLEKKGFSKDKQLELYRQRLFYIAPRPTIEKLLQEKKAA